MNNNNNNTDNIFVDNNTDNKLVDNNIYYSFIENPIEKIQVGLWTIPLKLKENSQYGKFRIQIYQPPRRFQARPDRGHPECAPVDSKRGHAESNPTPSGRGLGRPRQRGSK